MSTRSDRSVSGTICRGVLPHLLILMGLDVLMSAQADAQVSGNLFRRVSRASNFEFALYNDGTLWGDYLPDGQEPYARWPRGSGHLRAVPQGAGIFLMAKKTSRYLLTDSRYIRQRPIELPLQFNKLVPGWVGDPRAPYDPELQKTGWRYVDDADFIVYSSLDNDATGRDTSGNNYNDFGRSAGLVVRPAYVPDPLARRGYLPAYRSDEDLFVIYKDTDARANQLYTGPEGPSLPAGAGDPIDGLHVGRQPKHARHGLVLLVGD